MTDAELDIAIAAALKRAHEAPMGEYNLHADGTREIRNHTYAWAKASAEWARLCEERNRRAAVHIQQRASE